jgi:hypothetical protein
MTAESAFSLLNTLALVGWVLLAVLPGRRWVTDIATSVVIPALLAAVYVALIVSTFGRAEGGFSSLAGVASLFREPWVLLAGWVHYLAFDMLIGNWEVRDSRARGIPHLLVVPCLVLTFLFGPAGWLLYTVIRSSRSKAA